jgi:hypothetical protein
MHRNSTIVSTKQERIAVLAKQSPPMAFTSPAYLMDLDWLKEAYRRTRKDGAVGVDGVTAEEYERDLEGNLRRRLDRAKSGTHQVPPQAATEPSPPPVRPRDRTRTELPNRPRAAGAADSTRGGRRLRSGDDPAVLQPLGPPRRDSAGKCSVDAHGGSAAIPFPGNPVKLELSRPSMHAGRDGTSPSDGARVPVEDAAGTAIESRVDE